MVGELRLQVYTDGACNRHGHGGWAYAYKHGDELVKQSGAMTETTNNQMEMLAVIQAFLGTEADVPVTVYSDSQYVVKGLSDWIIGWKAKGWRTAAGQPVKNRELWEWMWDVSKGRDYEIKWVKGHNGNPMNELVDQLAVKAAYG